jgi:CheY-like chemotaxis protein
MGRHSSAGGEPGKARRRKTVTRKRPNAETKRKALEKGAEALLTKPIDFVTLRSEIDMRIEHAA